MNIFLFTSTSYPVYTYNEADDLHSLRLYATWCYCLWIFHLGTGEKFGFITLMINLKKKRRGIFICNTFIFSCQISCSSKHLHTPLIFFQQSWEVKQIPWQMQREDRGHGSQNKCLYEKPSLLQSLPSCLAGCSCSTPLGFICSTTTF